MGIFYKYIYTQMLLCRSSWGSGLQFTTCFLDPNVYPGLAGVRGQRSERSWGADTHTHSPALLPQAVTLHPRLPSPDAASWGPEYWFVVTLVYFSTDCPYLMMFLCLLCQFGEQTSTVIPDPSSHHPRVGGAGAEMSPRSSRSQKRSVRSLRGEGGARRRGRPPWAVSPEAGRGLPYAASPSPEMPFSCLLGPAWGSSRVGSVPMKSVTPWLGEGLLQSQLAPCLPSLSLPAPGPLCQGQNQESPAFHVPKEIPGTPKPPPPSQEMRLAADQTSIILYCNKLFECVYSYFLQSFHFVFNINGLSQIQKIIVMFNILQR